MKNKISMRMGYAPRKVTGKHRLDTGYMLSRFGKKNQQNMIRRAHGDQTLLKKYAAQFRRS